jgi:CubicO group peptidase (beta-lactamase class C family)
MKSIRSSMVIAAALLGAGGIAAPAGAQSKPVSPQVPQLAPAANNLDVSPAVLEQAKGHTFRPPHIASANTKDERLARTAPAAIQLRRAALKVGPVKPKLNVSKMGEDMHAALKDSVRGYAFQVRKGGQPIYTLIWDTARSANQGGKGWTLDTRMHVASVSKLMTAIGAVKMLDERNLSFDTNIGPYLPTYWTVGPNSNAITFRDLLTHKAGFLDSYYDGDYMTFKGQIAAGVNPNPPPNYTNGAFSLVRVLNATMTGAVSKNLNVPASKDQIWDIVTQNAFKTYMNNKVFGPSGVSGVSTTASPSSAFAYATKSDAQGWDSGELGTQLGGAGFRLSVNDLLDVMGTFRRKGTIVASAKAQAALDASLGIDWINETPAGKVYIKNGWWGGGGQDGSMWHVEQAVAAFLPDDMEAVVLSNSNIGPNGASLTNTFYNAIVNNIE